MVDPSLFFFFCGDIQIVGKLIYDNYNLTRDFVIEKLNI